MAGVQMVSRCCPGQKVNHWHGLSLEADRISFSFSFSAPKKAFFYFLAFYFSARKRCTYFRCILFFGINMAVKITVNSECFNSADARRAS